MGAYLESEFPRFGILEELRDSIGYVSWECFRLRFSVFGELYIKLTWSYGYAYR